VLSVTGTFAECVVLETLVLSVLNHDSAVASAAARMVSAADGRPLIEMGSRRTHERAAVDAARAAYLAGFAATSNLRAGQRYGIPVRGTAAHAFTMLHTTATGPDEAAAFRAQVEALGADTTLLVDTYDVPTGVARAIEVAGRGLGAVRVDSGDPREVSGQVRRQLDALGAHRTRIVVSGDLDEYVIEALRSAPVDSFGVGTSVVTGSGAPTASMVYKLTEVDGVPVAKRSSHKQTRGGRKVAVRAVGPSGTLLGETVLPAGAAPPAGSVSVTVALMRSGRPVSGDGLAQARGRVAAGLASLPADALDLTPGPPAFGMLDPSPR
jgi:nicotinate phosphoribosyltransferase